MKVKTIYPVCEYCGRKILPWEDTWCIELGADSWAHWDCTKKKIQGSNLPETLKDYAEEAVYNELTVETPSWEEDGTEI